APALSGIGDRRHVALTFDDGPDPRSTPAFLAVLRERRVRATFFLLGESVARWPALARALVDAGHEVGVHGWGHRCLARRGPRVTRTELARARAVIAHRTGSVPRWYRPAYGVATRTALRAARALDLTPVLWTDWGRDWTDDATAGSVFRTVTRDLAGGATVLLHDSPAGQAAPHAWRATLDALPRLLDHCAERGLRVGPLGDHGIARAGVGRPDIATVRLGEVLPWPAR
ncbi:MAG TPA: polysaccharide deacetylase family protein, partial [Pseudonocardia sp.]|nr:polysaccharide deacetylase family protein [Pseudonocardia sp.]